MTGFKEIENQTLFPLVPDTLSIRRGSKKVLEEMESVFRPERRIPNGGRGREVSESLGERRERAIHALKSAKT